MRLERRLFARKDYYYLNQVEAEALNKERNELAKKLLEKRKHINQDIASYNSVPGADINHNNTAIRSSNYKSVLSDTKAEANRLRSNALNTSTNTQIGKETNSFARKPKVISVKEGNKFVEDLINKNKSVEVEKITKLRADRLAKASKLRAKKQLAKGIKIGTGIAGGLALAGTGVYLYNKNKKKSK